MKKIFSKLGCFFIHNGFHKAAFLKKMNVFGSFGEKCFWHPRILPSEPEKVFIGNNVAIATDVYFCTHDINHIVLNNCERLEKSGGYKWKTGDIHIKDNTFIGAHAATLHRGNSAQVFHWSYPCRCRQRWQRE